LYFFFHLTQSGDASMRNINDAIPIKLQKKEIEGIEGEEAESSANLSSTSETLPLQLSIGSLRSLEFLQNVPSCCFINGRPKIKSIIEKIRTDHINETEKIALFGCGPKEMTDDLGKFAYEYSDSKLKFHFHQETFFL